MTFENYNQVAANGQQLATPAAKFNQFLTKHKSQLAMALPKHMNPDRMARLALTAFSQNADLAKCRPESIFASIIIASQLGLEPNVGGQGYLVPYNGNCTFIPGWKGLVDLVSRSGRATVWTGAVYEGDDFDYMLGDSPYCRHRPCGNEDKLTHVYAIGRVKGADMPIIEVWPIEKVNRHFLKTVNSKLQGKHYKHKHPEMYARKVALLQVLKYMPQSIEMVAAIEASHSAEEGKNIVIDADFVVQPQVDEPQEKQQEQSNQPTPEDIAAFEAQEAQRLAAMEQ